MPVVTMSGNIASGAREVGEITARLLGVDFVDQQLMVRAAQRCGVPVGTVAEHDERRSSFKERMSGLSARSWNAPPPPARITWPAPQGSRSSSPALTPTWRLSKKSRS